MSYRVLQITDCHLGDTQGDTLLGLDADYSLQLVLQQMQPFVADADLLVCTGDLSNEGSQAAFERLLSYLPDVPQVWLPGNHDSNALMVEALAGKQQFLGERMLGNWQLTMLDSTIENKVPGLLAPVELERAIHALETKPKANHIFFTHHPMLPVGCKWLDWQAIDQGESILSKLAGYPQLKAVVNGHVHQDMQQQFAHISLYSTPSTSVQFKSYSDDFALDPEQMPGFRVIDLHDDGRYETYVERIAATDLPVDENAAGY